MIKTTILILSLIVLSTASMDQKCPCRDGLFWNSNTLSCKRPSKVVANCQVYEQNFDSNYSICTKCEQGFALFESGFTCSPDYPHCAQYNTRNKECRACETGYYVDNNYKCQKQPEKGDQYYVEGCKTYRGHKNSVVCETCENPNYFSIETKCVPVSDYVDNCVKAEYRPWQYSQYYCVECTEGHFQNVYSQKQCSPNPTPGDTLYIEHCRVYEQYLDYLKQYHTYCAQCDLKYYAEPTKQGEGKCLLATIQDEKCIVFKNATSCKLCIDGYYPGENGYCGKCHSLQCTVRKMLN